MTDKLIQQFRNAVYPSFRKRADAGMDLIDALTVAGHVDSPVALIEESPFRRAFSMIFDTLRHAALDFDALWDSLLTYQPVESETIAGYIVYALDCTTNEREEAEALPERYSLKSQKDEPVRYGHKYSWLTRLVAWGTSWAAPQDILRVAPEVSDSQVGAQQVEQLAIHDERPKVVVEDSLYGNHLFLAIFLLVKNTFALVRLRATSNVLYEQPAAREPGKSGAPAKHGAKFKLASPSRAAEQDETFALGSQAVHVSSWSVCI